MMHPIVSRSIFAAAFIFISAPIVSALVTLVTGCRLKAYVPLAFASKMRPSTEIV